MLILQKKCIAIFPSKHTKATQRCFFSSCVYLSVFLLVCLIFPCTCFTLHFLKHQGKTSKMLPNSQVVEMFKFSSLRLTETKYHLLGNALERAHKSVRLISGNGTGTSDRWRLESARNSLDSVLIWPYLGICSARAVVKWRSCSLAKSATGL